MKKKLQEINEIHGLIVICRNVMAIVRAVGQG